jgi:hypothetical protein
MAHVVNYRMIAIVELGTLVTCFHLFGVWAKSMHNYLKDRICNLLYFTSQGCMLTFFLSGMVAIGIHEIYIDKPDAQDPTSWELYFPSGLMISSCVIQLIIGMALFMRIRPETDMRLKLKYSVSNMKQV